MLMWLILAFLTGMLVKYVDDEEDESKKKKNEWMLILFAIVYGVAIGYIISKAPFGIIFAAELFVVFIMRKVDTPSHITGVLTAFITALFFGLPNLESSIIPFFTFILFGAIDEWDDFIFFDKPEVVKDFRPFLEIGAIIVWLAYGNIDYLLGILAFDTGYVGKMLISKGINGHKKK